MPERKRMTSGNEGYENIPVDELVVSRGQPSSKNPVEKRERGENLTPFQENLALIQTRKIRIIRVVKVIVSLTKTKK